MNIIKKSLWAISLTLCSLITYSQEPSTMKVTEYQLENGLTVMLTENHDAPKIFGTVAIKAGGKNDPHDATGIAHYLEHVLFKGTQEMGTIDFEKEKPYLDSINFLYEQLGKTTIKLERDSIQLAINKASQKASEYAIANEMDDILKAMGATGVNAFTSKDFTAYINTFPSNQMEKWLEIYSHRFEDPVFRLFQSELETVYEEKNISMDGGFGKLMEEYNTQMYKNHPYGTQTILGSIEHLKNPSLTKMYEFFNTYYVANNMVLVLSGDFDTEKVKPMIEEKFGSWKSGNVPEFQEYPEEEFNGKELVEVKMSPIKVGVLGYRTPSNTNDDAFVFEIANEILSNNEMTGYLDQLSENGKLMESMSMTQSYNDYASTMIIYVPKIVGQGFEDARQIVLAEIERLKSGDFTDEYLQAIILNKRKELALSEENNRSRTLNLVYAFMQGKSWEEYSKRYEILNTITKQDIIDVANKYYGDNYLCLQSKMGFPKKEKIEKPNFEPVVPENEEPSVFAKKIEQIPTTPITPRYVNFEDDIQTKSPQPGLTINQVKNPFNTVFDLEIRFHVGTHTYPNLQYASDYLQMIGSTEMSSTDLKRAFHQLGASYYFDADANYFTMHIEGVDENLEKVLEHTYAFLSHLKADESRMKTLKDDLDGLKKVDRDEPSYISKSLREHVLYGSEASLQQELTKKELKKLTGDELVTLLNKVFTYEITVNYTGNVPFRDVTAWCTEYTKFSETPASGVPYFIREMNVPEQTKIYVIDRKKSVQSQITFNIKGAPRDNSIIAQINAYNNYFGGGMSGIVFQEIREFRSLAYSSYALYRPSDMEGEPNFFYGFIGCQSDKTNDAIQVMDSLINDMPEKPERMEGIISALTEKAQSSKPNFRNLIAIHKKWTLGGFEEDPNQQLVTKYPELTFSDIKEFQESEIKGKPMVITIVGDASLFDKEQLEKIGEVIFIKEKDLYKN